MRLISWPCIVEGISYWFYGNTIEYGTRARTFHRYASLRREVWRYDLSTYNRLCTVLRGKYPCIGEYQLDGLTLARKEMQRSPEGRILSQIAFLILSRHAVT